MRLRARAAAALFFALVLLISPRAFAEQLAPPPAGGIYHAAHPDFGLRDDHVSLSSIDSFTNLAEKKIAWSFVSFHWDKGIVFPIAACRTLDERGIVPLVGMMPWSTLKQSQAEKFYTLDKINAGTFDAELRRCARDVKDAGFHIMVEFGPEANGSWFPWSGAWNGRGAKNAGGAPAGPAKFAAAYRRVVTLFREEGADNVTWVFHVAAAPAPAEPWNAAKYYYPGDEYVDWIGASVYGRLRNGEPAKPFDAIMAKLYPELAAISPTKPIAILELGVSDDPVSGDKPSWIAAAFQSLKSGRYPRIGAVAWWNKTRRPDGSRSTLEIDSSPEALAAYREGVKGLVEQAFFVR